MTRKTKRWTDDDIALALRLRAQGLKYGEMTTQLGRSVSAISNALGRYTGYTAQVRAREVGEPIQGCATTAEFHDHAHLGCAQMLRRADPAAYQRQTLTSRLRAMADDEDLVLEALTQAYHAGAFPYTYFSPAYDATITRITALRHAAIEADAGELR